jgi:AraC-like DNA-binding protein
VEPAVLRNILPCAALKPYVRKYQVYRFSFEKNTLPPVKFHTPRPEHSITFYVREAQKFSSINSNNVSTYPRCVINGIYTVPLNRHGAHDFCAIKVVLQPTTLSRLMVIKVRELNNAYVNAEDFLGSDLSLVCDQLIEIDDIKKMVEAIELYLVRLVDQRCKSLEPIDRVSQWIVAQEEDYRLDWLASQSCLSVRQFIRRFEEQVGVSAKMYQKLLRFDRAYRLKNNRPQSDWLYIAIASGFYDYQHLVKDFKTFVDLTPTAFYEIEKASPERVFALHEF